jgi:hypothetical protein
MTTINPVDEKLLLFRDSLIKVIPKDHHFNYIVDDLDEIISISSGAKFRSCPFCRSMLIEGENHTWTCIAIGEHGGQQIVFLEGTKQCKYISDDGPYCNWHGFCLWQVHGTLGHPVRCKHGRIDAQSPQSPI